MPRDFRCGGRLRLRWRSFSVIFHRIYEAVSYSFRNRQAVLADAEHHGRDARAYQSAILIPPSAFILSDPLRYDFFHAVHVLGRSIDVHRRVSGVRSRTARRSVPTSKRSAFENAFQDFFDAVGETVGLGHALDLWFAKARAQDGGELAETVNALIVHLNDDDAFEFRESFFQSLA